MAKTGTAKKVDWEKRAWRRWRKAASIDGEGPFAVVAHCRDITVTLWETEQEAEKWKSNIDKNRCGGRCWPQQHEIVDLRARRKRGVAERFHTAYEPSR